MRILFSHRTQSRDGQAVHIEALVAAFRNEGHEVLVVGPGQFNRAGFGGESRALSVLRRVCPPIGYELLELLYNIPGIWRLLRACGRFQPDCVYERYNLFFFGGVALKFLRGLPLYLEVNAPLADERAAHGNLAMTRLARVLERWVWRKADRLYPVTKVLADYAVTLGVRRDAITINPNGVDLGQYTASPVESASSGTVTLGFVGFLRPWHGVESVISMLAEWQDAPDFHLVIVGEGPARQQLESLARATRIAGKVTFLGLVPRDRLTAVIRGFDIALQPSAVAYASPLKLFEYMALGRAIVAPDQPNIRELLTHDRTALLFAPDNRDALRNAVARLVYRPQMRRQLGDAARLALIERDYTWCGNARRIVAAHTKSREPGNRSVPERIGSEVGAE
ncbi:MAG: glycosyltransferase family 4 protein [Stellaceae bacterium]